MDLRQLRYFVAIIEAGSFTHASEVLGIAQPGLSQQIKKLEDELGVKLLRRHSRGVETTEAGAILLEGARAILSQFEQTAMRIHEFADGTQGRVTLGLTTMMGGIFAGPLLRTLADEAPDIQLSLVEEMSSVLMEWVAKDRLQMALAFNIAGIPGLRCEPVLQERLFFVEGRRPGRNDRATVTFSEVAKHALVVPSSPYSIGGILNNKSREVGIPLTILYEVQSTAMVRDLVVQRIAATVMPFGAVRREVEAGRLVARRIVEPEVKRDLFCIYSDRRPLSKTELLVKRVLLGLVTREMQGSHDWRPIADRQASLSGVARRLSAGGRSKG